MPSLLNTLLPALALASAAHGKISATSARSISTDSKEGKSLLARAVRTDIAPVDGGKPEPLRKLEIENMGGMYIKYLGCSDFLQYGDNDWFQNAYNNANGGGQNYYQNQQGGEGQQYNYNGQNGQQNGQNGQGQYNYQQQQNGDQNGQNQGQYNQNQGQYNQNQEGGSGDGQQQQQQNGYYGEDGQFYYYNNEAQQQAWQDVYMAHLVRFTLCENKGCYGCQGEYAVDMVEFVESYAEIGMGGDEYACEKVRENCYCYNNYREQCYYDCYQQAGMESCMEYYGQAEFQIQEYMECNEMDYYPSSYADANNAAQNGGGYYYNEQQNQQNYRYFVGPYCSANADVYLGAFYDENCMSPAGKSTFASDQYGDSFPYFFEPIIAQGECISCMEPERQYENQQAYNNQQYNQQYNNQVNYNNQQYQQNKNYNNQQYNQDENQNYNQNYENYNRNYQNQEEQYEQQDYGDGNELCQAAMEESIKCDYYNGFTYGCDYINNVLPTLDGRRSFEGMYNSLFNQLTRSKKAAIIFGTTAAIMLALVGCMCGYMWTQDKSSVRIGLLESRRTNEEFA